MSVPTRSILCGPLLAICLTVSTAAEDIEGPLQQIAKCGPNGTGSAAARQAAQELSSSGIEILPRLLEAMNTDNVVAANWYRSVYEQLVRREFQKTNPEFPRRQLREFVESSVHRGRPRRLVLSLLDRLEPQFRESFIATQLADNEFRQDAVAAVLKKGDALKQAGDTAAAAKQYQRAFQAARDSAQIQSAAAKLKSVGHQVSIVDHMGFVIDWYLLGPFDAPEKTGFDTPFPPEKQADLRATYTGKTGDAIAWKRYSTEDAMGQLNLVSAIAPVKEAVGYAYTEINSPSEQPVQLRCGADDNLSVWINGEKVFARKQWLNGTRLDRFTAPVVLRSGKNKILVKICQGPQHKNPAVPNNWSFQLRLCDETGGPIDIRSALPDREPESNP